MAKKKSYKPFKMWGSYVGLVLALIWLGVSVLLAFALGSGGLSGTFTTAFPLFVPLIFMDLIGMGSIGVIIGGILFLIVGFLLGWGIHSLVRKVRK